MKTRRPRLTHPYSANAIRFSRQEHQLLELSVCLSMSSQTCCVLVYRYLSVVWSSCPLFCSYLCLGASPAVGCDATTSANASVRGKIILHVLDVGRYLHLCLSLGPGQVVQLTADTQVLAVSMTAFRVFKGKASPPGCCSSG